MRALLILIIVSPICHRMLAQKTSFEYRPCFAAVIVSKIDSSINWYRSVFDLKIKNEMKDEGTGYRVVILESPNFSLELLQLNGSLKAKDLLKGKPEDTKIEGHFKIGFKVPDMDACLRYLKSLKIDVPRVWQDANTGKRNFLITDPDGNLLQFFE